MIIRNLDENSDWTFGSGKANYLTGNPAIGLNVRTRILSWLKDCFFDEAAGIDWANRLGSKNQYTLLQLDLRRIVLQSFGVTEILVFSPSLVGRLFTLQLTINTIFTKGYELTVSQELGNA